MVYRLLGRIPGIHLLTLPANDYCCGAAGSYVLQHPDIADRLRQESVHHLEALRPDILVTSNVGCALHLAAGLRDSDLPTEIMHPVSLLARHLVQER